MCRLHVCALIPIVSRPKLESLEICEEGNEQYGGSRRTLLGIAIVIVIVMIGYLIMRLRLDRSSRGRREIRESATCDRCSRRCCSRRDGGTRSLCTHIVTCSLGIGVRVLGSWLTCVIRWIVWWDGCSFWVDLGVHRLLSELACWWWRELVIIGIVTSTTRSVWRRGRIVLVTVIAVVVMLSRRLFFLIA